jgi:hypothetical protein
MCAMGGWGVRAAAYGTRAGLSRRGKERGVGMCTVQVLLDVPRTDAVCALLCVCLWWYR